MSDIISRRRMLQLGAGVSAAAFFSPNVAFAAGNAVASLTGDEALALLKKGNADFVADKTSEPDTGHKRRLEIAEKQTPFCAVLGCADSRVPPELLFGRGLGELFTVRVAGNVFDSVALGSLEYAVAILKVPLILVLGHENCGAVSAAIGTVENGAVYPGSINEIVEPIVPAVLKAKTRTGNLLSNAIRENARRVESRLRASEPIISTPVADGRVKLVSAVADLKTGAVTFLD